jgi:hypothetical protein
MLALYRRLCDSYFVTTRHSKKMSLQSHEGHKDSFSNTGSFTLSSFQISVIKMAILWIGAWRYFWIYTIGKFSGAKRDATSGFFTQ